MSIQFTNYPYIKHYICDTKSRNNMNVELRLINNLIGLLKKNNTYLKYFHNKNI